LIDPVDSEDELVTAGEVGATVEAVDVKIGAGAAFAFVKL